MTWDPYVAEEIYVRPQPARREPFDIDAMKDGRCKASTWRSPLPKRPTYQNHFGPAGFNRCIGPEGHANPLHKDEFGQVFLVEPFRIVRQEGSS